MTFPAPDPIIRDLVLAYLNGDAVALCALTDYLEERGDARAKLVQESIPSVHLRGIFWENFYSTPNVVSVIGRPLSVEVEFSSSPHMCYPGYEFRFDPESLTWKDGLPLHVFINASGPLRLPPILFGTQLHGQFVFMAKDKLPVFWAHYEEPEDPSPFAREIERMDRQIMSAFGVPPYVVGS